VCREQVGSELIFDPGSSRNRLAISDDLPEALIEAGPAPAGGAVAGLAGTPFHDAIRQAKKDADRDFRLNSRLNSMADVATLAAERLLPLTARGRLARGRAVTVPQGE
jgi:hypothetical protein